jgi:hypothetical protein
MELYYAIMNIVDYLALNKYSLSKERRADLIYILDDLLDMRGDTIEDIADANDCGECQTWNQLIDGIRELFETGERVPVRKEK